MAHSNWQRNRQRLQQLVQALQTDACSGHVSAPAMATTQSKSDNESHTAAQMHARASSICTQQPAEQHTHKSASARGMLSLSPSYAARSAVCAFNIQVRAARHTTWTLKSDAAALPKRSADASATSAARASLGRLSSPRASICILLGCLSCSHSRHLSSACMEVQEGHSLADSAGPRVAGTKLPQRRHAPWCLT